MFNKSKVKKYLIKTKKMLKLEEKLNDALNDISPDFGGYNNEIANDLIINMLKDITHDEDDWIGYYIYELDWGEKYEDGIITDEFGDIVRLKTYDDLINLLEENWSD